MVYAVGKKKTKKQLKYATKAPIIIVVVLQVFRWNVECEWSVPWQQPGAVAQLWGRASWCLCYWVRTTRLCNISSFVFSWLLQRINIYFLDFRSWTWALKHSSTWTRPKSRSGLRLWRGVYIPKRNIRGWAAKVAPWMIFWSRQEKRNIQMMSCFCSSRFGSSDLWGWCSPSLSIRIWNITLRKSLPSMWARESWEKWFAQHLYCILKKRCLRCSTLAFFAFRLILF